MLFLQRTGLYDCPQLWELPTPHFKNSIHLTSPPRYNWGVESRDFRKGIFSHQSIVRTQGEVVAVPDWITNNAEIKVSAPSVWSLHNWRISKFKRIWRKHHHTMLELPPLLPGTTANSQRTELRIQPSRARAWMPVPHKLACGPFLIFKSVSRLQDGYYDTHLKGCRHRGRLIVGSQETLLSTWKTLLNPQNEPKRAQRYWLMVDL